MLWTGKYRASAPAGDGDPLDAVGIQVDTLTAITPARPDMLSIFLDMLFSPVDDTGRTTLPARTRASRGAIWPGSATGLVFLSLRLDIGPGTGGRCGKSHTSEKIIDAIGEIARGAQCEGAAVIS